METYINKICKDKGTVRVAVNNPKAKKYCNSFVKGEDGYCINYVKPEALVSMIKIADDELKAVKVYEPAVVNCSGQCKVIQTMAIGKN